MVPHPLLLHAIRKHLASLEIQILAEVRHSSHFCMIQKDGFVRTLRTSLAPFIPFVLPRMSPVSCLFFLTPEPCGAERFVATFIKPLEYAGGGTFADDEAPGIPSDSPISLQVRNMIVLSILAGFGLETNLSKAMLVLIFVGPGSRSLRSQFDSKLHIESFGFVSIVHTAKHLGSYRTDSLSFRAEASYRVQQTRRAHGVVSQRILKQYPFVCCIEAATLPLHSLDCHAS